jgi:hypothetical protein
MPAASASSAAEAPAAGTQHEPAPPAAQAGPASSAAAGAAAGAEAGAGSTDEEDLAQCPICQFIEAGECKADHQVGHGGSRCTRMVQAGVARGNARPGGTWCGITAWGDQSHLGWERGKA